VVSNFSSKFGSIFFCDSAFSLPAMEISILGRDSQVTNQSSSHPFVNLYIIIIIANRRVPTLEIYIYKLEF
jgi:hypothetical protein